MDRATAVWEGGGGARTRVASEVAPRPRHHRTLWIGVLYVVTIIVVVAFAAKLN